MICKNCGSEIKNGAQFCTNCGAPVELQPSQQLVREVVEPVADLNDETRTEKSADAEIPGAKTKKATSVATKKKMLIIGSIVAVILIAVVALVLALSSSNATNELKQAVDSKDAYRVNSVYNAARDDASKIEKYDQLIADTIESMQSDLNAHDFDTAALSNAGSAVTDYASSQWGTLMYNPDGQTLSGSVSSANEPAWEGLVTLYDSKTNYCDGLYAYKTNGDYESAISSFMGVTEADSEFDDTAAMIGECADAYISATLTAVEEKIAEGDINGGLQLLNAAEAYLDECGLSSGETAQQLTAKIEETLASYADTYAQKAETCFKDKDVNGAIGNMEVAMELQPDNADYKTKYDTYQQYIPFELYLEENVLYEDQTGNMYGNASLEQTLESNNNQSMANCIRWYNSHAVDDASYNVYYNLEGKYDVITGIVFLTERYRDYKSPAYFQVYGDGKLIYTSPKISAGVLPQAISFKVSGVQKLTISFRGSGGTKAGVSNLVAQKAFPSE